MMENVKCNYSVADDSVSIGNVSICKFDIGVLI